MQLLPGPSGQRYYPMHSSSGQSATLHSALTCHVEAGAPLGCRWGIGCGPGGAAGDEVKGSTIAEGRRHMKQCV